MHQLPAQLGEHTVLTPTGNHVQPPRQLDPSLAIDERVVKGTAADVKVEGCLKVELLRNVHTAIPHSVNTAIPLYSHNNTPRAINRRNSAEEGSATKKSNMVRIDEKIAIPKGSRANSPLDLKG